MLSEIKESRIEGTVREGAHIDGILILGEGSVVLPGVYMEGVTVIGKNCKIGPNCYFRGNTSLGDNCHVGQAVEVKNSMLMNKVSAGHLSYIGDSIVGSFTNFGAGTITSNFRHDGKNHTSKVCGKQLDVKSGRISALFPATSSSTTSPDADPAVKRHKKARRTRKTVALSVFPTGPAYAFREKKRMVCSMP